MKLEKLAMELFDRFTLEETGKVGKWQYLNDERKLEWMAQVLFMAKHFELRIKKELKPVPTTNGHTSYEMGFQLGVASERAYLNNLIETTFKELQLEFDAFKAQLK